MRVYGSHEATALWPSAPTSERRGTHMKLAMAIAGASGLVLGVVVVSGAEMTKTLRGQTVTVSGTVDTIDHDRRDVNIRTDDGKFVAIEVPERATEFSKLKVGD